MTLGVKIDVKVDIFLNEYILYKLTLTIYGDLKMDEKAPVVITQTCKVKPKDDII